MTAPGPDRVIEKGLWGPGFLAHVATERFGHHMPYYRLEKKYADEGLERSRSVLERSMARCAELFEPIYQELEQQMLASEVIFTDDTPVTIARPADGQGSRKGLGCGATSGWRSTTTAPSVHCDPSRSVIGTGCSSRRKEAAGPAP